MNFVAFGLILICCNVRAIEMDVEKFLKKLKTILRTGEDKLGIPVLDPFTADSLPIKLNEEMITLEALLTKLKVDGLSEYNIIKGDVHTDGEIWTDEGNMTINVHLSWPLIAARTYYSMEGKADDFNIYGNGEMKMSAQDFAFDTEIKFEREKFSEYLKLNDIKLNLSLRSLDFHATGLYDDEEMSDIISAVISKLAPELISDDMIVNKLTQFVREKLDAFVTSKTIAEILTILILLG